MSDFVESPRFPIELSAWAVGGPRFLTSIAAMRSGFETRNVAWAHARAEYDLSTCGRTHKDKVALIKFFRAMRGMAYGFRFKDHDDYAVSYIESAVKPLSATAYAMYKLYGIADLVDERRIAKPVVDTVTVKRGALVLPVGTGPGHVSVDHATGVITIAPEAGYSIASITRGAVTVITTAEHHDYESGDLVILAGVTGASSASAVVEVLSATSVKLLGVDSTNWAAYSNGGAIQRVANPADVTFSCEFDIPVRFDVDALQGGKDSSGGVYEVNGLRVVEILTP